MKGLTHILNTYGPHFCWPHIWKKVEDCVSISDECQKPKMQKSNNRVKSQSDLYYLYTNIGQQLILIVVNVGKLNAFIKTQKGSKTGNITIHHL